MSAQTTIQRRFAPEYRAFWWRKLHSLSGVVPVGVYLLFHLWTNAKALQGRDAFNEAVDAIHHIPYLLIVEIVGIYLPLLFHAFYGIRISLEGRSNLGAYPLQRNWAYVLQRVTGIVSFAFIAYHVWQFRVQVALGKMHHHDFFTELCAQLSSVTPLGIPVVAVVYLIGIAAAAYHFSNGLHGFCFSWGITGSARASRVASGAFGVLGLVIFILGANTVVYYATGSRLVLSPASGDDARVSCVNPNAPPRAPQPGPPAGPVSMAREGVR